MGRTAPGIILVFLLVACQHAIQNISQDKIYRPDLQFEVNGVSGEGVAVVPRAGSYTFSLESKKNVDVYALQSCHKEIFPTGTRRRGRWGDRRRIEFVHVPSAEDQESVCPVQISLYQKAEGKFSWAYLDFQTEKETLPAELHCNGEVIRSPGVSVCRSRAGLRQRIIFPVDVDFAGGRCELGPMENPRMMRFNLPVGVCVFAFMEKKKGGRVHRLTTIGYQDFIVNEDN